MSPQLWLISDAAGQGVDFGLLREACQRAPRGALLWMLRDRSLPLEARRRLGERFELAREGTGQWLGVAGDEELARALRADVWHLGSADAGRGLTATTSWGAHLSRPLHDGDPLPDDAASLAALLVSPFAAERKGRSALGAGGFSSLRARAKLGGFDGAFVALGGLTAENARTALEAGADAVAVMGAAGRPQELLPLMEALGIAGSPMSLTNHVPGK